MPGTCATARRGRAVDLAENATRTPSIGNRRRSSQDNRAPGRADRHARSGTWGCAWRALRLARRLSPLRCCGPHRPSREDDHLGEVEQRATETVDFIGDDTVDLALGDVSQEPLQ